MNEKLLLIVIILSYIISYIIHIIAFYVVGFIILFGLIAFTYISMSKDMNKDTEFIIEINGIYTVVRENEQLENCEKSGKK